MLTFKTLRFAQSLTAPLTMARGVAGMASKQYSDMQPPRPCWREQELLPMDGSKALWRHQAGMPMLPVPTLEETAQRYLATARPLLNDAEFAKTQAAVAEFLRPGGAGETLQARLLARKGETDRAGKSWLIDWWNDYAYMSYRDPVVVNVSYFFVFKDDPRVAGQVARAAQLVQGALAFRRLVVEGTLKPEMSRTTPLDMHMFRFLFNQCRIPALPSDVTRSSDSVGRENQYIVVVRKNRFWRVNVLAEDGSALSTAELEAQIGAVVQAAGAARAPAVGALTSDNRDEWARERDRLVAASPLNASSLDAIERATFVVCLDDTAPVTKDEASRACWHGDGQNRFYDKPLQFVVFANGKAGFLGEHSMMDATPTSALCDFVCTALDRGEIPRGSSVRELPSPVELAFELDPPALDAIGRAEARFGALVGKHELVVCAYDGYGKNAIKKMALSPDAYAQLAIQLAYFKMYGRIVATYESATARKFATGRTEVCRTCSSDSVAWVRAMADPSLSAVAKGQLGRKAVAAHSKYMADCVEGRGVDRHLLGLRLLLQPGEPKPAVFSDPAYARTSHWQLSTSQITSEYYDGYGWGEVVPDGYGIAYMVKNDCLSFNVACLRGMHADRMSHFLKEALGEMRLVFEATVPVKAKL